ncbi:class I SAM-dependent methyltransferase [Streptomyces sp. NPDC058369]|uniref:class I SAM-dependent methyltransferase n=1 Tax=Streptomyces sp. NPDC058369 TaxID=3346462 RepID=UPI00365A8093
MTDAAGRLSHMVKQALGRPLPLRLRAWDGSEAGPSTGPVLVIRDRRALHRLAWKPGELGLARAWVAGEIDIEGDLYEGLAQISGLVWNRSESEAKRPALLRTLTALRDPRNLRLAADVLALAGPALPPAPPREEAVSQRGPLHSLRRDRHAISHHYDVGNDFYSLVLGPSMVYSCAYWENPESTLEEAQHAKLDLICRKLGLKPGQRLLDVGCGWGSMVLHAVQHYGVEAVGVTISEEQAALARKRLAEAGCTDRAEIRVQDYREIDDGPFDAISSIGMAEHVGSAQYRAYAQILRSLLKPGGRLLNHQIARRPLKNEDAYRIDEFIDRYVFPDGELAPVATTAALLEDAGFEVRDVEALREHYALTLRAWVTNLENRWSEATRLTTSGRARVWRLYMAASALAFEQNNIGVNQIFAVRTTTAGNAKMPPTRGQWLHSTTED